MAVASSDVSGVISDASDALMGLVTELTVKHGGGTLFFDELDERLRDVFYFNALTLRAIDEWPYADRVVVSGRFGEAYARWFDHSEFATHFRYPVLVVAGGLRHAELAPFAMRLTMRVPYSAVPGVGYTDAPQDFVFIDDSAYRFRTYGKVKKRVEEAGGTMLGPVIAYDGSAPDSVIKVPSFFRWHS